MRPLVVTHLLASLLACAACKSRDAGLRDAALRRGAEQPAASADPMPAAERGERPFMRDVGQLEWLAANSPLIFVGRLRARTVERDGRGLIVTRNEFSVEEVVRGRAELRAVTLTTLGGTIGGETLRASGMPAFSTDQTYLVFCDPDRGTYDPVTANDRGVFPVVDGDVFSHDGHALLSIDRGRLRFGEPSLGRPPAREPSGAAAGTPAPRVSGGILSVREASPLAGRPMRLDEFIRSIRAASPR